MSAARILFIDRDGTLVEEPPDEQVDSVGKVRLLPGVIPALLELKRAGYRFVLVSNQDGLGTDSFPEPAFRETQDFIRGLFASQGIEFDAEFFCPHRPQDGCDCRKPRPGMARQAAAELGLDLSRSWMVGDKWLDVRLGHAIGGRSVMVRTGWPRRPKRAAITSRSSSDNESSRWVSTRTASRSSSASPDRASTT